MPRVSVAVPVYNCELYLAQALDSIVRQTYRDFELICVDDGSTDESLRILREFEARDARVRVISRPNTGIVGALNDAIEVSRGEYLARMDGDDIAESSRFSKQIAYLDEHPECVALGTRILMIDPDGLPLREWSTATAHEEIDRQHIAGGGGAITHPSSMMRLDAVRQVGLYRDECIPAEDLDLFLRLAEVGRLANLEETLLSWRMHFASTGSTKRVVQRKATVRALEDAFERRGLPASDLPEIEVNEQTKHDIRIKWVWWALAAGQTRTARKHALECFRERPFSLSRLKLLYCAARGH